MTTHPASGDGRRILITGAGGFIGKHLAARLKQTGAQVICWTRDTVDLRQTKATLRHMQKVMPHSVIHLATSMRGRADAFVARPFDLLLTINVLEAISALKVKNFIHVGTLDEYGPGPTPFQELQALNPLTSYAAAKASAGLFWTMAGGIHVRLPLVYGEGQDLRFFVPQLLHSLVTNSPLPMSLGEQVRDFISVEDVVEGLIRLLGTKSGGECFNLCTGQGHSLQDIVRLAQSVTGRSGSILFGSLPYRDREIFQCVGSPDKLISLLGWRPAVALEAGLRQIFENWNSRGYTERSR